jgi:hypothetical protein
VKKRFSARPAGRVKSTVKASEDVISPDPTGGQTQTRKRPSGRELTREIPTGSAR